MKSKSKQIELHPEGETPFHFKFHPSGGSFHLKAGERNLTAYGGLVAWDYFLKQSGILELLADHYPIPRTSPNATPVKDILSAFMLNCLVGGKRFAHMRRLQDDEAVAQILGLTKQRLCGEDTFRRLCSALSKAQVRTWITPAEHTIYQALPENSIADWDSTVNTKYGHQEDTAIGYNPHKPGRKSLHPLVCSIAGTRLALHMEWGKGNTVSASNSLSAMEKVWSHPLAAQRIKLNRGDIGFGQEKIIAWHESPDAARPNYLFKLKLTKNIKRSIQAVDRPDWKGSPTEGMQQITELKLKLSGWSKERRIVVSRTLKPLTTTPQDDFWGLTKKIIHAYVTDLTKEQAEGFQIIELYKQRADSENVFDELKNQWGFTGFSSQQAVVSESASRILLLTYNLWTMFTRVLKNQGHHSEATTSRYELLLIPGRLITSGRQKTITLSVNKKLRKLLKSAYQRLQPKLCNSTY